MSGVIQATNLQTTNIKSATGNTGATIASNGDMTMSASRKLYAPGHIVQVLQAVFTDVQTVSSADTRTDITNLSVAITPSSASSKILVNTYISYGGDNTNLYSSGYLMRDSTDIGVNTTATNNQFNISFGMDLTGQANETYKLRNSAMSFLDRPSSTSSLTYKVQVRVNSNGTLYINRPGVDANADYGSRGLSTLTVMEVAG